MKDQTKDIAVVSYSPKRLRLTSYAYGSAGSVYSAISAIPVTCDGGSELSDCVGLVKLSTNCGSCVSKKGSICIFVQVESKLL